MSRPTLALVLVAIAAAVCSTAMGGVRNPPRLGKTWAPFQKGYGRVRPTRIYNGGDPTGDVTHIRWRHWGRRKAIGRGRAVYVRPRTVVAENGFTGGARVVAFHVGTCRGYRSYNAVEWYFPKYGETFDPRHYIKCLHGEVHRHRRSEPLLLADQACGRDRAGARVEAIHIRCSRVRKLIARSRAGRFAHAGGQLRIGSYRCGTDGDTGDPGRADFECVKDRRSFLWALLL
jgi:hypothetical protein